MSSRKTRRIFEQRGLRATFCVISCPQQSSDSAHLGASFADWAFWRSAYCAGHDVAPHGWAHERLVDMPFEAARDSIERALEHFGRVLPGFRPDRSVFHVPYLHLPDETLDWLRSRCAAVRLARARPGANMIGDTQASGLISCIAFGPDDVGAQARATIKKFGESEDEWLVLVLHGLDGEGWGPIATSELQGLLNLCSASDIKVRTVADVLGLGGKTRRQPSPSVKA